MLVLTVRDGGSRCITRRVDGPVSIQPFDGDEEWYAYPDEPEHHVALVTARHEPIGRLGPGDAVRFGAVTVSLERSGDPGATDRIVAVRRRAPLALALADGRQHLLGAHPVVVGSAPTCDVVLRDRAVSARHCEVVPRQGAWVVRDLGSTNGTWVGDARVPSAELAPGIAILLGRTRIACVRALAPEPAPSGEITGRTAGIAQVRAAIERFAPAPYPVLIEGESGAGKELVAREIHARSPRRGAALVTINCGALAADVVESELFGHERGAFTGAVRQRRGVFEEAHGGTLFLDEIGELPLELQPKLLRVLETGELRRVGGEGVVKVDVRLISATLRDLGRRVAEGLFRPDLYYRLSDFRVRVPPLRERCADIPLIAQRLLARIEVETGRHRELEDRALGRLVQHPWPGNVRELLQVLKRASFLADNHRIGPEHVALALGEAVTPPPPPPPPPAPGASRRWPDEVPSGDLGALLAWCEGNRSRAARIAGISRSTLRARVARALKRG